MKLETQQKIKSIVSLYTDLYFEEYQNFLKAIKIKQVNTNDYGDVKMDTIEKFVYEIPETLFNLFVMKLNSDETAELNDRKGAEWFAKTFKQFSMIKNFNKYV